MRNKRVRAVDGSCTCTLAARMLPWAGLGVGGRLGGGGGAADEHGVVLQAGLDQLAVQPLPLRRQAGGLLDEGVHADGGPAVWGPAGAVGWTAAVGAGQRDGGDAGAQCVAHHAQCACRLSMKVD